MKGTPRKYSPDASKNVEREMKGCTRERSRAAGAERRSPTLSKRSQLASQRLAGPGRKCHPIQRLSAQNVECMFSQDSLPLAFGCGRCRGIWGSGRCWRGRSGCWCCTSGRLRSRIRWRRFGFCILRRRSVSGRLWLGVAVSVGVPATTFEGDSWSGDHAFEASTAVGAFGDLGVGELLAFLRMAVTLLTLVFVERHRSSSLEIRAYRVR